MITPASVQIKDVMSTNLAQPAQGDSAGEKKVSPKRPFVVFPKAKVAEKEKVSSTLSEVDFDSVPDDYRPPDPFMACGIRPHSWTILFAPKKSMKSFFQFQVCVALASGTDPFKGSARFENYRKRRVRCLMVSSEMNLEDIQTRHGSGWKDAVLDPELKTKDGKPLRWMRVVCRTPITMETLQSQASDPYQDIIAVLDDMKAEGYPCEMLQIDNLTTIWPAELSKQEYAARLGKMMLALTDKNGGYGVSLMTSMHLNKHTEYDYVNTAAIKGNELFVVMAHNLIAMNRSSNRMNGAYLVELESRFQDQTEQHHRNNAATFTVYPEIEHDVNSPVWLQYEGADTEASQTEGKNGKLDDLKHSIQAILREDAALSYKSMKEELVRRSLNADALVESTYYKWRDQYRKAAGLDGATSKLKFETK